MKYLRTVKGCNRLDQIRNEDIRNELGISSKRKNNRTRINGKHICKEWNIPTFHYRHININHLEKETWIDQEEDGERENNTRGWDRRETTILEDGTGDSPNP
jgi:hypothetical protein